MQKTKFIRMCTYTALFIKEGNKSFKTNPKRLPKILLNILKRYWC